MNEEDLRVTVKHRIPGVTTRADKQAAVDLVGNRNRYVSEWTMRKKISYLNKEWITYRLMEIADIASTWSDRIRALELLGKHIGYFNEPVNKTSVFAQIGEQKLAIILEGTEDGQSVTINKADSSSGDINQ